MTLTPGEGERRLVARVECTVCEPVLQAGEDNGANRTHKEPGLMVTLRVVDVWAAASPTKDR